jgi:hypothetical protein
MSFGKLTILMAWKGHFLTQIPHPTHNIYDISLIGEVGRTSIQIF